MGFITSVSGGAGVFAVPTMLAFGIPPVNVLALNRMSDVGVVLGAIRNYLRAKVIDWPLVFKAIPFLALGAYVGANAIVGLSDQTIKSIVVVGVIVGMMFLMKPARPFINKDGTSKNKKIFGYLMLLIVGAWSGAIAMAGATFALLVFVYLFDKEYVHARATEIAAAIPETLISAYILVMAANVDYRWLIAMFVSSFVGAFVGSKLAIKHGEKLIKKAIIAIGILMLAKILFGF